MAEQYNKCSQGARDWGDAGSTGVSKVPEELIAEGGKMGKTDTEIHNCEPEWDTLTTAK